jgi:hypothetical protein
MEVPDDVGITGFTNKHKLVTRDMFKEHNEVLFDDYTNRHSNFYINNTILF